MPPQRIKKGTEVIPAPARAMGAGFDTRSAAYAELVDDPDFLAGTVDAEFDWTHRNAFMAINAFFVDNFDHLTERFCHGIPLKIVKYVRLPFFE
jgi:hypothetical protein